jgi:hypothetical protein
MVDYAPNNQQVQSRITGVTQGLYEQSATQQGALGSKLELEDGRVFRYAHFVAAVNRGVLVSQDVSVSSFGPIDGKATAAAIAAKQVTLTDTDTFTTADVADVYQGGYLMVEDDAGEGYTYRIQGNDAGTAAGVMVLDLFDGLVAALTTDSDVAVIGSLYKNLSIATANGDSIVSGAAVRTMTAGYYGWIQTWGPCSVLCEVPTTTAPTIGNPAFLDDGTSGAVGPFAGVASNTTLNAGDWDTPYVGDFLYAGTDTAHVGVFLKLIP